MMFSKAVVLLVIASAAGFIYGVGHLDLEVEPNACRMTYMFGQPLFAPVRVNDNKQYPNYGLYYYYESTSGLPKQFDPHKARMRGAPVIFVPGNAGSYKQVRSLGSVALRKAISSDSGIHLDYYTIDFDEELSGLYGGYLYRQQAFLKLCIRTVLSLYQKEGRSKPSSLVLIGHSMGGKVAQSVLTDEDIAPHINTILTISTPLDQPVINLDSHIADFYSETNQLLLQNRSAILPTPETNLCKGPQQPRLSPQQLSRNSLKLPLDRVLMISTGGGNRDLLVRASLTSSILSDIHAMTSSIPRVQLSCDHLSAVWCLQFMQVITRFLFSISRVRDDKSSVFNDNKPRNLELAAAHFVKPHHHIRSGAVHFHSDQDWHEEKRLVINKFFANGLKTHYYELIGIRRREKFKKMVIEVLNVEDNDWLFGCAAQLDDETDKLYCAKGTPLPHLVQRLPTGAGEPRNLAVLDLEKLRRAFAQWTHVLIRLPPGSKRVGYNLDIYEPKERTVELSLPRWYAVQAKPAINETLQGTLHYKLHIADLTEPFQGMRLYVEPLTCLEPDFRVSVKLCVPWTTGYERYETLTDANPSMYVNVPQLIPKQYNTTRNPIVVDLYLDPNCRYSIYYQYSYPSFVVRLLREFYYWLPAHLTCVLFIVLKNQVEPFYTPGTAQGLKPYFSYLQFTSIYIVTGVRLLKKFVLFISVLPPPESLDYSMLVSLVIHSTAIALSVLAAFACWLGLMLYGNAFYRIALRLTRLSEATSNIMLSIMTHLPITFGIVTVALAVSAHSGIALLVAFIYYFVMLSNAYKDYLEDYLWQQAAKLLKRSDQQSAETTTITNITATGQEVVDAGTQTEAAKAKKEAVCEPHLGMKNFPYHITLLLLLFVVLLLNTPATFAWLRSRRQGIELPDPSLYSTVVTLSSLSLLLQLKAPQKGFGYQFVSGLLYICAGICLLYCQAGIYRLNYIIALGYALLVAHQIIAGLCRKLQLRFG